jgi:hypothetical protein
LPHVNKICLQCSGLLQSHVRCQLLLGCELTWASENIP